MTSMERRAEVVWIIAMKFLQPSAIQEAYRFLSLFHAVSFIEVDVQMI